MASLAKFFREVRTETKKVVWPSRKETMVSTLTVLVLVFVAAIFFTLVDGLIASLVELILGFGG
jgi:preprotein translocase subunit SecE